MLDRKGRDMTEKKSIGFHLIFWLGTVILLVLDRVSKHLAAAHLKDGSVITIVKDVFCLQYLENRGAAFGLLQGKKVFFVLITLLFFGVICWIYSHLSVKKHFYPVYFIMSLFLAGAAGNFLDRIFLNYVIDFLYFELIDFPIFNVADIYVTCGAVLFFVFFLFYYKEKDFNEMSEQVLPGKKQN